MSPQRWTHVSTTTKSSPPSFLGFNGSWQQRYSDPVRGDTTISSRFGNVAIFQWSGFWLIRADAWWWWWLLFRFHSVSHLHMTPYRDHLDELVLSQVNLYNHTNQPSGICKSSHDGQMCLALAQVTASASCSKSRLQGLLRTRITSETHIIYQTHQDIWQ